MGVFLLPRGLQVVVFDYPYRSLLGGACGLFGELMALKIAGYQTVYPFGVLPVDTYDFIATHLLICTAEPERIRPLAGFRVISEERCETHLLPFPAQALLRDAMSDTGPHLRVVQSIFERARERGAKIDYYSAWTISPELRNRPDLRNYVRDLMVAMLISQMMEGKNREHMLCGVIKVKTDDLFKWVGFFPLSENNVELPAIRQRSLFGENVQMLHTHAISTEAPRLAQKFTALWQSRITLPAESVDATEAPKKAA